MAPEGEGVSPMEVVTDTDTAPAATAAPVAVATAPTEIATTIMVPLPIVPPATEFSTGDSNNDNDNDSNSNNNGDSNNNSDSNNDNDNSNNDNGNGNGIGNNDSPKEVVVNNIKLEENDDNDDIATKDDNVNENVNEDENENENDDEKEKESLETSTAEQTQQLESKEQPVSEKEVSADDQNNDNDNDNDDNDKNEDPNEIPNEDTKEDDDDDDDDDNDDDDDDDDDETESGEKPAKTVGKRTRQRSTTPNPRKSRSKTAAAAADAAADAEEDDDENDESPNNDTKEDEENEIEEAPTKNVVKKSTRQRGSTQKTRKSQAKPENVEESEDNNYHSGDDDNGDDDDDNDDEDEDYANEKSSSSPAKSSKRSNSEATKRTRSPPRKKLPPKRKLPTRRLSSKTATKITATTSPASSRPQRKAKVDATNNLKLSAMAQGSYDFSDNEAEAIDIALLAPSKRRGTETNDNSGDSDTSNSRNLTTLKKQSPKSSRTTNGPQVKRNLSRAKKTPPKQTTFKKTPTQKNIKVEDNVDEPQQENELEQLGQVLGETLHLDDGSAKPNENGIPEKPTARKTKSATKRKRKDSPLETGLEEEEKKMEDVSAEIPKKQRQKRQTMQQKDDPDDHDQDDEEHEDPIESETGSNKKQNSKRRKTPTKKRKHDTATRASTRSAAANNENDDGDKSSESTSNDDNSPDEPPKKRSGSQRRALVHNSATPEVDSAIPSQRSRRYALRGANPSLATPQPDLINDMDTEDRSDANNSDDQIDKNNSTGEGNDLASVGPEPYKVVDDPNNYYVEEEAYIYHNPPFPSEFTEGVTPEDLKKIPPPPPLPTLPDTGHCEWSFDTDNRVLMAKFDSPMVMDPIDEKFFAEMMERDDITLISEGLLDRKKLDPKQWNFNHWATVMGDEFYHKFRRFDTESIITKNNEVGVDYGDCKEVDHLYSMKMKDYMEYLYNRKLFFEKRQNKRDGEDDDDDDDIDDDDDKNNVHNIKVCVDNKKKNASKKGNVKKVKSKDSDDESKNDDVEDDGDNNKTSSSGVDDADGSKDGEDNKNDGGDDVGINDTSCRIKGPIFTFYDHKGVEHSIHVGISCLYMIDLDVNRYLPSVHANFMESFGYRKVLPGGKHCMMNSITSNARPFMGPNVYITPPAAFTHFHQDGHGTVDSGHLVIKGYNEVVMLRRLTERHKKHALMLLTGNRKIIQKESTVATSTPSKRSSKSPTRNVATIPYYFDGLYSEPHGDGLGEKPSWPSHDRIQDCKKMGYCPSVIILKPGQLIHINKGRLHAFRKMSTSKLPDSDCHSEMRAKVVEEEQLKGETICVSVAWDWMFRGATTSGINREVSAVIEATILNRKYGKVSLAIPETSLLQMARKFIPERRSYPMDDFCSFIRPSSISSSDSSGPSKDSDLEDPDAGSKIAICRGFLPALRYVVRQHVSAMEAASNKSKLRGRGERVTVITRPNTQENPLDFPVDPYGNSDFFCKLCSKELSNVYYHCDGCETLLSKDFNICRECHAEKKFMVKVQMHPLNDKRHSTINHIGDMHFDRFSRCPCKNGPVCRHCTFCAGCSCRCHSWFTLNSRFFGKEGEELLLQRVEDAVEPLRKAEPNDYLDNPEFLEKRFALAAKCFPA